jgi:uncharacterized protein YjbI with pentapeptide repeats
MTRTLAQIWQQFQQSFLVETDLNETREIGTSVLSATPKTGENHLQVETVPTLLQNSSSFFDVLCLPFAQVLEQDLSYTSLGINFLNLYAEKIQECPSLEECVFIISQTAYLQSIKEILSLYPLINWDINHENIHNFSTKLAVLQNIKLEHETAQNAIICFQESELAAAFNHVFLARLISPNVSKFLGTLLTKRIAAKTHEYIINTWQYAGEEIQSLIQDNYEGWEKEQELIQRVDEYLQTQIENLTREKFLDQSYSIRDIYITPKIQLLADKGHILDLEAWVKGELLNQQKLGKVMLVEGDAGSGKSVFCRMFADWVRDHLHPLFTPILINLREINNLVTNWDDTLQTAIKNSLMVSNSDCLTKHNTKFLFILDGLEDVKVNLEIFLQQVGEFQEKCKIQSDMGHHVLITCRTGILQYINKLPDNLDRVEILDFDQNLQEKWLKKWASLPENKGQKIDLCEYVSSKKSPLFIKEIFNKPIYLHLLNLMYRDDILDVKNLEQANQKTIKVAIWQEFLNWLMAKQNIVVDNSSENNLEIPDYQSYFKRKITETAVMIFQSGGIFASKAMIKSRLENQPFDITATVNDFYFIPSQLQAGKIGFFHQTFCDFLFANRLATSLQEWSRFETEVEIQSMNWQIYDLLGFGKLTSEILENMMSLLRQVPDLHWINLFKVLENFYQQWSKGKFIDSSEETLAQTKLKQLQEDRENDQVKNLGQRQIDIYAGLNVMILLMEIQRYAQQHDVLKEYIIFYPSGETQGNDLTSDLLNIINYCNCLQGDSFNSIVGQFFSATHLRGANLFQADLSGIDFSQADLSRAELSRSYLAQSNLNNAYLIAAKLTKADLFGANLSDANMIRTDLRGADLRYANLQNADMSRVDLSGANLQGANLSGAYLMGANFSDELFGDVRWDENTNWEDVEGLEAVKNLPGVLKQQLKI